MSKIAAKKPPIGSAFDLLSKSYEIVTENWRIFLVVNILGAFFALLEALNPSDFDKQERNNWFFSMPPDLAGWQLAAVIGGGFLIMLIFLAVNFFFFTMSTSLEVKSASGKKPNFNELLEEGKKFFFPLLGLVIVASVIVIIGLFLLIIPGIIAISRLAMAPYLMVDKKLDISQALTQSNELGKKYFSEIWAAILVMLLVSGIFAGLLGVIPILGPIAGFTVSVAFSLVLALRYRQLSGHKV